MQSKQKRGYFWANKGPARWRGTIRKPAGEGGGDYQAAACLNTL